MKDRKPKTNKLIEEIVSLVNKWQTKSDYPYPPIRPLAKEITNLITQTQQETLEEIEKLLPYGAEFTDRFYKLKKTIKQRMEDIK